MFPLHLYISVIHTCTDADAIDPFAFTNVVSLLFSRTIPALFSLSFNNGVGDIEFSLLLFISTFGIRSDLSMCEWVPKISTFNDLFYVINLLQPAACPGTPSFGAKNLSRTVSTIGLE